MSTNRGSKELTAAIRAPFMKRHGLALDVTGIDNDFDNDYGIEWADPTDSFSVEGIRVDADGNPRIGREAVNPQRKTVTFALQANGSLGTQAFFVCDRAYRVTGISYVHKTLGTNGSAVTCYISHETSTQAPGAGTSLMTGTFNCKSTNAVVQNATLAATPGNDLSNTLLLATNDRLSIVFTGTLTALAGIVVTVYMSPAAKGETAVYYINANADIPTAQYFFIANRDMTITSVRAIWSTAFAAAVTLDVTKDTSTNAPGAGTSILAATVAADGTANTVATPALAATAATLQMAAGDRLSVKLSAATTGIGLVVVVSFSPTYSRKEVAFQLSPNTQQQVSQYFFIADRDYLIEDISEVHGTAAGGAATIKISIDKGTNGPGAGATIAGNTGSLSFDLNGTSATVQVCDSTNTTLAIYQPRRRLLSANDRLGINISSGAAQSLANMCITASLRPV